MAQSPLEVIFEFCDISQEHVDFVKKTLYKYKDDPVVNLLCGILHENSVQNIRMQELFSETNFPIPKTYPLIIPSPNSPNELRVYPNIILDNHDTLDNVSPTYCQSHLKTFLTAYDTDMAGEKSKQKWSQERAEKRLLEFIDYPTARALQRYVFTDGALKDHNIRDCATNIDNNRKPMELIFCKTPQDYAIMYGSGPHSCMADSAANKINWQFLKEEGLCPASWYHYCEYTTGVYVLKNGKVAARSVLFKGPNDKNWTWVKIYPNDSETNTKFQNALAEQGITRCIKPEIPNGYTFTIPGIRKGAVFAAPWPYLDSPIPSPHANGQSWNIQYNNDTHEFIFHFNSPKYDGVRDRSGHIISSDYSTMECTCCGKVIKKNEALNIRIEHDYHVFCSDNCAALEGFVKVCEGTGNMVYKQDEEGLIPVYGSSLIKFSTLQAARDNGYYPTMIENGIFPEDNNFQVSRDGLQFKNAEGQRFMAPNTGLELEKELMASSKVPFRTLTAKKVVEYNEEKLFVAV
jgi:hypothetical protein